MHINLDIHKMKDSKHTNYSWRHEFILIQFTWMDLCLLPSLMDRECGLFKTQGHVWPNSYHLFFFNKSDFKCLAFQAGYRSALPGPHRAKPNATPCRAWSHGCGARLGPQRAAPPTYTASHQSLKINSRKYIRGHWEQGSDTAARVWRRWGFAALHVINTCQLSRFNCSF